MEEKERMKQYMELSQLAQDFVYVAKTYGKIIITERYSSFKTIQPVDLGGVAVKLMFLITNRITICREEKNL